MGLIAGHTHCDDCGKVYNPRRGDCFWSGPYAGDDGDVFEDLCNGCRRANLGGREAVAAARRRAASPA